MASESKGERVVGGGVSRVLADAEDAPETGLYRYQDTLPDLPLPELNSTLDKLLESSKPFLTEEEFEHTHAVIEDFRSGVGKELQEVLEERAKESRNWLEEWWEKFAYLRPRYPAAININWHGVLPGTWGAKPLSQAEASAVFAWHILKFATSVRDETMEPEKMAGQPLCMHTYTRMFRSTKVPDVEEDELVLFDYAKHIVVLRNNAVFAIDVLDDDGQPLPVTDLLIQFERILELGTAMFDLSSDSPVSVLTSENRTTWAKARDHMIALDPANKESLDIIDRALFVAVLDSASPTTLEEVATLCLHGDGRNKWFDKPFNLITYENGRGGVNGEHAWADAMVVVRMFDEVMKTVEADIKTNGRPKPLPPSRELKTPRKLRWVLDTVAHQAIEMASTNLQRMIRTVDLRVLQFKHFGKTFIRRYKLVPDFFVQMAIQLAYFRLHNRVVATYESGHTRLFYHGRTETIKTTGVESVAFVNSMQDPTIKDSDRFDKLKEAIRVHKTKVRDAVTGQGIDRHLMGLYIVSEMMGKSPRPALFTDKGFLTSKKYILSTSNISMQSSPMFGGFFPMYEDGYGICYGIQDETIKFSICANNVDKDTNASAMRMGLETALMDMQRICLARNVIYVGASKL